MLKQLSLYSQLHNLLKPAIDLVTITSKHHILKNVLCHLLFYFGSWAPLQAIWDNSTSPPPVYLPSPTLCLSLAIVVAIGYGPLPNRALECLSHNHSHIYLTQILSIPREQCFHRVGLSLLGWKKSNYCISILSQILDYVSRLYTDLPSQTIVLMDYHSNRQIVIRKGLPTPIQKSEFHILNHLNSEEHAL